MSGRLPSREVAALAVLATILAITAAWWALALWPLPADAAPWLVRTRDVCFGTAANGLPTSAGWMVLIGQPLYMLATLWLISGQSLKRGLQELRNFRGGRAALAMTMVLVLAGLGAAGARVALAEDVSAERPSGTLDANALPRLDSAPPALALINQDGRRMTLAELRGRPVLVTFAFAHCETVCPLIVHDVLAARRAAGSDAAVVVVTLDPWRDAPARLSSMARAWQLDPRDHMLGGTVSEVEEALDRWQVSRGRDPQTGMIVHVPLTYVIDAAGRIAFVVNGSADAATYTQLLRRL